MGSMKCSFMLEMSLLDGIDGFDVNVLSSIGVRYNCSIDRCVVSSISSIGSIMVR